MEEQHYFYTAILLSFFLIVLAKSFSRRKKNLPRSPLALPIIGHFYLIKNSLHQALDSLSTKYGPVLHLRFGCRSFLVISSPSGIEECLAKNDIVFANRPQTMAGDIFSFNYTNIVWASYGPLWRQQRRLAAIELFSTVSMQRSSIIREEEIQILIRSLFRVSKNGSSLVDVKNWMSIFTFNAMKRLVSGKRFVDEEDVGGEKGKQIVKELRGLFVPNIPILNVCDFFPVLRWLVYKGVEKKMVLLQNERIKFLNDLLYEFQQTEIFPSDPSVLKATPILKTLLSLQTIEPELYTDDVVKSFLLVMFVGGTETSSVTIEQAMAFLLAHPEALHKLKAEIDREVGHGRLVNESDLPRLPYLRCVVNETLRLYPPAPFLIPHYSSEDCMVGGYNVPKDTILTINVRGVHRDPEAWPEPEKFEPERFEAADRKSEGFGFKFVTFGLGRRACPGNNMALRAVSLALAAVLQVFDWENVGKDKVESASFEAVCTPRHCCIPLLSQL